MLKIIHSAKKAIEHHNKIMAHVQELHTNMENQHARKEFEKASPKIIEPGLEHHLVSNGLPTHFSVKMALAKQMGINNYTGTKEQDHVIMTGHQAHLASQAEKSQLDNESKGKEKEHSLKEREVSLKERQSEAQKLPTADEIADAIIKKSK